MQEWFKAADLAGLEGMPNTHRSIRRKADRENWHHKEELQNGGLTKLYHISSLPEATREALALKNIKPTIRENRAVEVAAPEAKKKTALFITSNEKTKERARVKLDIVLLFKSWKEQSGLKTTVAREKFAILYNEMNLEHVPIELYAVVSTVSSRTILNWENAFDKGELALLGGKYGNRAKSGVIDSQPSLKDWILGHLQDKPHISSVNLLRSLKSLFKSNELDGVEKLPALRTLERWLIKWKAENKAQFMLWANPDAYKNNYQAAFGSYSVDVFTANQRWELDSTPADVMCTDGRYSIVGAIDVFSRKVKIIISKTSNSEAICTVMRKSIMEWGVPQTIKTDNGADYKSQRFMEAMAMLEIHQEFADPFSGEQKPHIERFFGTMTRQLFEQTSGYIGHDVAGRKAIEARRTFSQRLGEDEKEIFEVKLSSAELQILCDNWIENIYSNEVHSSINMTPNQKWESCQEPLKMVNDERALDMLMAKYAVRRVVKKGIKLDSGLYSHPELVLHMGKDVAVFYDPEDISRIAVYSTDFGEFICMAIDPERDRSGAPISRVELSKATKRAETQIKKAFRAEGKKQAQKLKGSSVIGKMIEQAKDQFADENSNSKKLEVEYVTEALEATLDAINSDNIDAEECEDRSDVIQLFNQPDIEVKKAEAAELESHSAKYDRWLRFNENLNAGAPISKKDFNWYSSYPQTIEFQVEHELRQDFEETLEKPIAEINPELLNSNKTKFIQTTEGSCQTPL